MPPIRSPSRPPRPKRPFKRAQRRSRPRTATRPKRRNPPTRSERQGRRRVSAGSVGERALVHRKSPHKEPHMTAVADLKQMHRATWASGDYAAVANMIDAVPPADVLGRVPIAAGDDVLDVA